MTTLRLELTSADIPGTLDSITHAGVHLLGTDTLDLLTTLITIDRKDYAVVADICRKRGDQLRLQHRSGVYYLACSMFRRPILLLGMIFLIALIILLPERVLFVRVEGNRTIPANRILEVAEYNGIQFGANRRLVRSEQVKNNLLADLPELKWAGVNTCGCVAVITVRERQVLTSQEEQTGISSIVAACDGVILSATALEGNLLCSPGQAVSKGDVLISGYTDCGLSIRGTVADGEIIARTRRSATVVTPAQTLHRGRIQTESVNYSLIVGKKRINLWKDSGISDGTCGRMYEEYYITLPGGFQLPFGIATETVTWYEFSDADTENPQSWLAEFSEAYLSQQMIAGQILDRQLQLSNKHGCYRLEGVYFCTEMIGRRRQEQIGETHG